MKKRKIIIEFTEPMTPKQYDELANKVCVIVGMLTEAHHWVWADDGTTTKKLNQVWRDFRSDVDTPWEE
jgi:hypothetical protein